jgi:hypothetical protein
MTLAEGVDCFSFTRNDLLTSAIFRIAGDVQHGLTSVYAHTIMVY